VVVVEGEGGEAGYTGPRIVDGVRRGVGVDGGVRRGVWGEGGG